RKFVRKAMPEQHRAFFPMLPFVLLGAVDAKGDVWATVRAERPGFIASPEPEILEVRLPRDAADPADHAVQPVAPPGLELDAEHRDRIAVRH
ncbi:flavin-nucleotide-binding protein, partial [Rhizobium ruizarguesonis]